MAENVQWIRLMVGMFDGGSFKKIKRAEIGGVSFRDKLTAVWFELLDLAGKSNANGYLIDSNEIPYRTFADIAVMLDREEEEIELCMEFFLREQMVEIIDDIFCLTNFIKYQSQEGLEKIREQKRVAQAKWRSRKKQGLIENRVDSTVDSTRPSTGHLPSYSLSSSTISIFEYWNTKDIIKHREITEDIAKAIEKALKVYPEEAIKTYIDRYAKVVQDETYFFAYKWTLKDFLTRKDGIASFTDEGSKWVSYTTRQTAPAKGHNVQPKESSFKADDFFAKAVAKTYGTR